MSDSIPVMQSRPVIITPYTSRWVAEYQSMATRLRAAAGSSALRIDHIGSTSVPELAAKDVIDVQITVADITDCAALIGALQQVGFTRGAQIEFDMSSTLPERDMQLAKRYMREPVGERRTHIHIRQAAHLNQRMALLFRDYLRATPAVRAQYETIKRRAAQLFPENIDGYIWLKDAPIQIIHEAAVLWAAAGSWAPGSDHD